MGLMRREGPGKDTDKLDEGARAKGKNDLRCRKALLQVEVEENVINNSGFKSFHLV